MDPRKGRISLMASEKVNRTQNAPSAGQQILR